MSFHVFFDFSVGLAKMVRAPIGTKARTLERVRHVESTLGIKRTTTGEPPTTMWDHWDERWRRGFPDIDNKVLCETVQEHNDWVRRFYIDLETWAKTPVHGGEKLKPKDAAEFWHGLHCIKIAPERWTPDYYRNRMEHLYEVMRGREDEGVTLDAPLLSPKQAAAVIRIFDEHLDPADLRLDVPDGHDFLASSYDGGYDWCDKCFKPKTYEDGAACRRRKCPLVERCK